MARSETRVLVVVCPGIFKHIDMMYRWLFNFSTESCLWEEMCFPIFSSQSVNIIPTSPDGKSRQNLFGQFFALKNSWWIWAWDSSNSCYQYPRRRAVLFFSHKSLDCGFLEKKVDEAILSQIFFESEDQFWHPCGFNYNKLMLLCLYLLLTEKIKNNTLKRSQTFHHYVEQILKDFHPNKNHHPTPHWFLGDLQLPGAAAKKHLELKSAKAEEIRSWERKWREAGPDGWPEDGMKLGANESCAGKWVHVFFGEILLREKNRLDGGGLLWVCVPSNFHNVIHIFSCTFSWHGIFKKCWCAFCVFMNPNHIKVCLSNTMWTP